MFIFKLQNVFIELFVTLEWFDAYYSAKYKSIFSRESWTAILLSRY